MNRKERRKNKITQKDPVFVLKKSDLEQKLQESYQKGYDSGIKFNNSDAVAQVLAMLLGLPCKVLKEKYGWGFQKRLPDFADAVLAEYEHFDESTESLKQLRDFIYENTGIKFERVD